MRSLELVAVRGQGAGRWKYPFRASTGGILPQLLALITGERSVTVPTSESALQPITKLRCRARTTLSP